MLYNDTNLKTLEYVVRKNLLETSETNVECDVITSHVIKSDNTLYGTTVVSLFNNAVLIATVAIDGLEDGLNSISIKTFNLSYEAELKVERTIRLLYLLNEGEGGLQSAITKRFNHALEESELADIYKENFEVNVEADDIITVVISACCQVYAYISIGFDGTTYEEAYSNTAQENNELRWALEDIVQLIYLNI